MLVIKLDLLAEALTALRPVRVRPARCLPARSPRAVCGRCQEVCPEGAVTLTPAPELRDCSACGLCAAVCPADLFILDGPSDQHLLRQLAEAARRFEGVALACRTAAVRGAHVVQIPCLGRLTPEFLFAAAACGAATIELVGAGDACAACLSRHGGSAAARAVDQVLPVLKQLGQPCAIRFADQPSAPRLRRSSAAAETPAPVQEDRRTFLLAALGLLRQAAPGRVAGPAPGTSPQPDVHAVPEQEWHRTPGVRSPRRAMLQWGASQMPRSSEVIWPMDRVALTGACQLCGVCMALCPNQAIAVVRGEEGDRLEHLPSRCSACGLCVSVCPAGALTLSGPGPLKDLLEEKSRVLGRSVSRTCEGCGESFQAAVSEEPAATLCLACQLRAGGKGSLAHA